MKRLLSHLVSSRGRAGRHAQKSARARVAPLFDADFYLATNPDIAGAGVDPLGHYLADGFQEARQPHPLFDADWYVQMNTDVREAGVDPLAHYLDFGWKEGRRPHPLFDIQRYQERYGIGSGSDQNPLLHYIQKGWRIGYDPHLLFKTTWYLCHNRAVAKAGIEPLGHYLTKGWLAGTRPNPVFDPAWYLAKHNDVGRQSPEPLRHYLLNGAREGRAPNDTLEAVRKAKGKLLIEGGVTPLEAYVLDPRNRAEVEPVLFDAAYYRATSPGLKDGTQEELHHHFVTVGYHEGSIGASPRTLAVAADPKAPSRRPWRRPPVKGEGKPRYSAPLVIGGFHRSGTSMTANLFADAGLHVGDELLGARPSNPYGHFEDREIIAFHDGLLRQIGQNWQTASDFPPLLTPKDWRFMVNYGSRKAGYAAWGFKDPRVCLFLPEWHATFPDMSLLYVYRPCVECVHSLRKRAADNYVKNRAVNLNFNFFRPDDIAIKMYLNYSTQALRFIEKFDGRLKVIALSDLLENRDIVAEVRRDWGYKLADVLPFDVYDGVSLTQAGPNEIIYDPALLDEVDAVERRFEALLS